MTTRYKGIYLINGVRWERYQSDLFRAIQDLHAAVTGSGDLNIDNIMMCRGFIKARLMDWVDGKAHTAQYDDAVQRLCLTVLQEYGKHFPNERPPKVKVLDESIK